MSHNNKVIDKDPYFEIDPITRAIKNISSSKTTVIQYDHNSERFTFSLPRFIEEHDMLESTKAEVHYINISAATKEETKGLYEITDLKVDPEDENKVICTWLLSQNATKNVGVLQFLLRFSCLDDKGEIEYAWNTAIHTGISVSTGMYNTDAIVEQYADVLEQWAILLKDSKIKYIDLGEIEDYLEFMDMSYGTWLYFPTPETLISAINGVEGVYNVKWDSMDGTQYGILIYDWYYATQRLTFYVGGNCYVTYEDLSNDEIRLKWKLMHDIGNIETALDSIIDIQNSLIGGDA